MAQLGNAQYYFFVVLFVILKTFCTKCQREFFAQLTVISIGHKRYVAWVIQRENPTFLFLACSGFLSCFNSTFG